MMGMCEDGYGYNGLQTRVTYMGLHWSVPQLAQWNMEDNGLCGRYLVDINICVKIASRCWLTMPDSK